VPGALAAGDHRVELMAENGGILVEAIRFVPD
jgi:hypothetical protein